MLTGNTLVPARYQDAIDSGIRFFECRTYSKDNFPRAIANVVDVVVNRQGSMTSDFSVNWLTGDSAFCYYRPIGGNKDRYVLSAFIPDDRCMHNKIILLENPRLMREFFQLHTRSGTFPADDIKYEFTAMNKVLKIEAKALFLNDSTGHNIDWGWEDDRDRLEQERETQLARRRLKRGIEIVEGKQSRFRPEIEVLKTNWLKNPNKSTFGWVDCEEFRKVWIPKIEAEIKLQADLAIADPVKQLMNTLTPDQYKDLAAKLVAAAAAKKEAHKPKELVV